MYPLTGKWNILPGNEKKVIPALKKLAKDVQRTEPGTLLYMVFTPNFKQKSLPAPAAGEVIFFEIYKDQASLTKHLTGPNFTNFVKNYGHLFLQDFATPSNIFMTAEVMTQIGGFARGRLK